MSIQDIVLKIKGFVGKQRLEKASWALKGLLLAVTGILIGITGFFCGKIAYARTKPADPISVIYPPQPVVSEPLYQAKMVTNLTPNPSPERRGEPDSTTSKSWNYAGSKTGKTYYTKDCKGINRVKPQNRVYFITAEQAKKAGYSPSKTCANPSP